LDERARFVEFSATRARSSCACITDGTVAYRSRTLSGSATASRNHVTCPLICSASSTIRLKQAHYDAHANSWPRIAARNEWWIDCALSLGAAGPVFVIPYVTPLID